jgi:endonuclease YncB( thermonuclease family)
MSSKNNINFWLILILAFLFFPSLFLNLFFFQKLRQTETKNMVGVLAVLDGDTIVLENKTRLRLRHIDAPELELCGGIEAKEFLEKFVSGKKVVIDQQIPDQQGRAMALIYVDQTLINREMLKSGWARYHSDTTSLSEDLKKANDFAKQNQLGIYSSKCYQKENKENPSCQIKGNIEHAGRGRRLYYLPNCAQYQFVIVEKDLGEQWFCSEKEARSAGYTKAATCPK